MNHQRSRSKMWRASNVTRASGSSLLRVELGHATRAGVQTGGDVARHRRVREVTPEKLARPCLITPLESDSANRSP